VAHRLAVLGGAAALVLGTVSTAYAATGSPPVTAPDHAVVRAGEPTPVDVAANDTDVDGDRVQACRLGELPRALRASVVRDGEVYVLPGLGARGTYALTYYACDDSFLTPGTLTVEVRPPAPTFRVEPVGDAPPGRIRLVNEFKHATFRCSWHELGQDRLLGKTVVPPRSTEVVTVHVSELEIDCDSAHMGVGAIFTGSGERVTRSTR
jgi:hypothetical protein